MTVAYYPGLAVVVFVLLQRDAPPATIRAFDAFFDWFDLPIFRHEYGDLRPIKLATPSKPRTCPQPLHLVPRPMPVEASCARSAAWHMSEGHHPSEIVFFSAEVSPMNRWEALTRIVSAFVDKGHPGYALLAMTILCGGVVLATLSVAVAVRLVP